MFYYTRNVVESRVMDFIYDNLGDTKLLDEWTRLLNEQLPKSRRMTKRQYGIMFSILNRKGKLDVQRTINPCQYCFSET